MSAVIENTVEIPDARGGFRLPRRPGKRSPLEPRLRPRIWRYENGGPISVVLTVTLEATPSGGTRMTSRGVWTPYGWFRIAFPVFIRVMRRAERGDVANARQALEQGRDAADKPS